MLRNVFAFSSTVLATLKSLRFSGQFPFVKMAKPDWPDLLPATIHPVVVVPGLLGTWPPLPHGRMDPVTGVYYNLLDGLEKIGYVPGVSLFSFGYDWRRSAAELAPLLATEIRRIQKLSPKRALGRSPRPVDYSKVDLVCHSMGGLVGRTFVQGDDYNGEVNRLVLVASPQQGAMAAYYAYEGGDSNRIGVPIRDAQSMVLLAQRYDTWLPHRKFDFIYRGIKGVGLPDLFDYVRANLRSIHDFLPVKQTNYLYSLDENGQEQLYPFGLPDNTHLEKLDRPDNLDRLDKVAELAFFYSSTVQTLVKLKVDKSPNLPMWEHGKVVDPQPASSYGPGDSIVPRDSAFLVLPPTKTDGSTWQVKVCQTDLGQQLNRSLDHVQIVGDPDAVRRLLQYFVRPDLPPIEASTWDGPALSARKPDYVALVMPF
ncbi:MAG: hypothetical protein J0I20_16455 [Chloroflexi bacterium]|nr:hypothetical protein [Chloroflexota bacterium]OJV88737.1 MAG: hypothetical protein BGO39_04340 [Chloroflexi bacterium 54-19]